MASTEICPICRDERARSQVVGNDVFEIRCTLCGIYRITGSVQEILQSGAYSGQTWVLAGLVRNATANRQTLLLKSDTLTSLIESAPIPQTPTELLDRILIYLSTHSRSSTNFLGDIRISPQDFPLFYLDSPSSFQRLMDGLASLGYIVGTLSLISSGGDYHAWDIRLTVQGWKRIDELRRFSTDSWQAFVAMAFRDDTLPAYKDGIVPALRATGYEPFRVDLADDPGRIDDRIMGEIRRSGLVIADFTHHRGGVYFEAGVAIGRGIPVIWCCHEDHFKDLHFDTRQYNHIGWRTPDQLKVSIENRIRANFPTRSAVINE